jgi:predicted ATPase
VLDNCEHIVDGIVTFVERLLSACPNLVVLATSRARLVVPFERVFSIPGLSVADDEQRGDAVTLFLERAGGDSALDTPDQLGRIPAICRALGGVALAIELAAARLPTLGIDGIEAGLADQLRLLAGGPRIDDRHRSLRATLDWSYALLDPVEQAVLRRTSGLLVEIDAEARRSGATRRRPGPPSECHRTASGDARRPRRGERTSRRQSAVVRRSKRRCSARIWAISGCMGRTSVFKRCTQRPSDCRFGHPRAARIHY